MNHLKTYASALALTLLVACGGDTVSGPTNDSPAPVASAPQPTATPQPVAAPPISPQHDAKVKGGSYSITNTTGISQFYCAAAFGVLPGGEQGAGTNLFQDQGERRAGDTFSGQAPKVAACQYKQIQVDLTQSKDCRNFNWQTVLAAEVYSNPDYIEGTATEALPDFTEEWGPWSGSEQPQDDTVASCGTRTRKTYTVKKYKCSGEIVRTYKSTETETKACCAYPSPSYQLSGLTFPTYTPAIPDTYYYYWDMNNGQGDTPKKSACEGRQGVWLGDYYDIPNDNSGSHYDDVCRTTFDGLSGQQGVDADFIKKVKTGNGSPASGGNPISGSATVSGAGVWKLVLKATDPGSYDKDVKTKTLDCNGSAQLTVSYNWIGHSSDDWQLLLYRDNVLVASSAVVNNPSN